MISSFGKNACGVLALTILFVTGWSTFHGVVAASQGAGRWITKAPAPSNRTEVAVAAIGTKLYVVGGLTWFGATGRIEEYDRVTDQWEEKASLPVAVHHAGMSAIGDRLYVVGGFRMSVMPPTLWKPVSSTWEYIPSEDRWIERAPMPTARGALAVGQARGKLHAVGGYDGTENTGAHEVFDPSTNLWIQKAPLPTPRDHLAVGVVNDRIYALGGRRHLQYSQNLAINEAYHVDEDRWQRFSELPTPRSGITAAVHRDRIYVFGGESPEGTFRVTEAFIPPINQWIRMPDMPTPRHGLGSAVIGDQIFVVGGGSEPGGSFSGLNEVFLPAL